MTANNKCINYVEWWSVNKLSHIKNDYNCHTIYRLAATTKKNDCNNTFTLISAAASVSLSWSLTLYHSTTTNTQMTKINAIWWCVVDVVVVLNTRQIIQLLINLANRNHNNFTTVFIFQIPFDRWSCSLFYSRHLCVCVYFLLELEKNIGNLTMVKCKMRNV